MCEHCKGNNSSKVSMGIPITARETASKTQIKDLQIFIHPKEGASLMVFDRFGCASYININYCPICGRKLKKESK